MYLVKVVPLLDATPPVDDFASARLSNLTPTKNGEVQSVKNPKLFEMCDTDFYHRKYIPQIGVSARFSLTLEKKPPQYLDAVASPQLLPDPSIVM